jgi:putative oxidoreductase
MRFLKKLEPFTLILLRCGLALVFIYHGYPKLFGSTESFIESFQAIGLPAYFVYVAGAIEFFGGLALALGLFTPVAGLLLVLDMGAAMWKYNFNQGIYAVREYELPLILGLASLVVVAAGGGPFSLDRLISSRARQRSNASICNLSFSPKTPTNGASPLLALGEDLRTARLPHCALSALSCGPLRRGRIELLGKTSDGAGDRADCPCRLTRDGRVFSDSSPMS